nr:putative late blight resistance protein homolog R1B-14 [Ipomoea batatas]
MEAVIEILVNKVETIVKENVLKSFNAYLKEAYKNNKSDENAVLADVVEKIQGVVDEAQDAIDQYVIDRRKHLAKGVMRYIDKVPYLKKVNDSAKKIDGIKQRAVTIRQEHSTALDKLQSGISHPTNVIHHQPVVEEEDVVGFDGEAQTIKDRLNEDSNDLAFISIVGMPGLGKTTLTKKVFSDNELQYEFFTRLWVYVSQNMNRKQIFMNILSNFTKQIDDFKYVTDDQLAERIKTYLEGGKYLIVMDDVWEMSHFKLLKIAFPNNRKGSRVLVTTRELEVAKHADSTGKPHNLKFLSDDESWELLQKKVFRKEVCPQNLEPYGKSIAKKCNGLPLAIVVIAGVLNVDSTPTEWIKVDKDPFPVINQKNQDYNELVKLSYNKLDFHKKNCFLYLAVFPMGHEICAWKLIRLWIAEGIIPPLEGSELEGTAEKYLKDIVDRNLLMVLKKRADGEIKTCRLHDTMHVFCKLEALNKKLFQEIDGAKLDKIINEGYRRLCIHSSILSFISSENMVCGDHIRSFLTSSPKLEIPKEHFAKIPKAYPLLSVFDAEALKFESLPKELYQLYHLRFLAVTTDLSTLSKLFTDLWNMQTLILNTTKSAVQVKADIWSMPKLRHILSNASLVFPPPKNGKDKSSASSSQEDLQTLSTISPNSCIEDIFAKTPNLLKLGVRGNLAELLESKGGICLFDNIHKLHNLDNLKLLHESANDQGSMLWTFPRPEKFPGKLRKLTLHRTSFRWKDISTLASLDKLEVLKLEESAVKGDTWELNKEVVFNNLQFLRIGRTDLATWTCGKDSFPVLKSLYLSHCECLNALPLSFKDVKTLKLLYLFHTNKKAAPSAQKIRDHKPKGFELTIFPPIH